MNPGDLSLEHLHAQMRRIDVLIRREVVRFQAAGQDPADTFRGLFVSDAKATALAARPFATSWGQLAVLDSATDQSILDARAEAQRGLQVVEATAAQKRMPLRLRHLVQVFGLSPFELDALLVTLAPALDLRYERLYGYLQDDVTRKRPSVNLVLDLLCESGPARLEMLSRFADDSPLIRSHLIEKTSEPPSTNIPLLAQTLVADDAVIAWLLGDYHADIALAGHGRLEAAAPSATDLVLADEYAGALGRAADSQAMVVMYGADEAGQESAAHILAAKVGRPLLRVQLAASQPSEPGPLRVLQLALRDARMIGAVVLVTHWDVCLADGSPSVGLLAEVCAHPDIILISGRMQWQARGVERQRTLTWIEFPIPEYPKRRALWEHYINGGLTLSELELTTIAGQFLLTSDQIRDAVAMAMDHATQRGTNLEAADLFLAARSHSSPGLNGHARKIEPRYTWHDIVLPDDQRNILEEIVATVRGRPVVLEEWGLGKKLTASDGVTVLFAGPPGTGKTMAAEVIASELQLDLYKIELSSLVSKYIGETEKNLERIFKEAESSNAILFFDEADAIFGKRSEVKDAHDRYANIEVSYLLQRMEAYDGVTILATNLRANLDDAFTRRLSFAVDFPFPDEHYRELIWQTLFPPTVPRADGLDLNLLAKRFRLAGGSIRNIIVNAAYLAASNGGYVTMEHLLHSARRELQKMGRLVKESDMTVSR